MSASIYTHIYLGRISAMITARETREIGIDCLRVYRRWPEWRFPNYSNSLLYPTAKNLRSTYVALHAQYEPWLLGDLVRRSPGTGASSDGTFRLMLRTKTDGRVRSFIRNN